MSPGFNRSDKVSSFRMMPKSYTATIISTASPRRTYHVTILAVRNGRMNHICRPYLAIGAFQILNAGDSR